VVDAYLFCDLEEAYLGGRETTWGICPIWRSYSSSPQGLAHAGSQNDVGHGEEGKAADRYAAGELHQGQELILALTGLYLALERQTRGSSALLMINSSFLY
jgi:hypothetical protein